jgi:hypothetical protein
VAVAVAAGNTPCEGKGRGFLGALGAVVIQGQGNKSYYFTP